LLNKLLNVFRIPELRNKLGFTIALLCVYRIGFYVPLPGVDAIALRQRMSAGSDSPLGVLSNYLSVFSGGSLSQSTIFGLGIMPYISASIILQLLGTVVPSLEKLKKEGEPGIRKINDWTRQLTVLVCLIQAAFYVRNTISRSGVSGRNSIADAPTARTSASSDAAHSIAHASSRSSPGTAVIPHNGSRSNSPNPTVPTHGRPASRRAASTISCPVSMRK
jgi:preprotein translocase subunit SecY